MVVSLREYQQKAVDDVRTAMRSHRRVLLVSPTGSGKTVIFSAISAMVWAKHSPVTLTAHRIEIIEQISDALTRADVRHGIIAPGHPETRWPVQVGMVQTIANRIERVAKPRLFVIDEAHHAVAGAYRKIAEAWPDVYTLGVSASPQRLDGKGLSDAFDVLVQGPTVTELMDRGFLCRFQYYAPPVTADLSSLHSRMGDFVSTEVAAVMDQRSVTGDAEAHYRRMLNGRPAIAFCSSVEHAQHVAEDFCKVGWKAAAVDGSMEKRRRKDLIAAIGDGRLNVLTSCDIISEGTDIPVVSGAILLRPTQSSVIFLQQVGRVLRPKPDGSRAVILDHVGNVLRHGMPDQAREWSLEGQAKRAQAAPVRQCPKCYLAFRPAPRCPNCQHEFETKKRPTRSAADIVGGDLAELKDAIRTAPLKDLVKTASTRQALDAIRKARGYHPNWTNIQMGLRAKAGQARGPCPNRKSQKADR